MPVFHPTCDAALPAKKSCRLQCLHNPIFGSPMPANINVAPLIALPDSLGCCADQGVIRTPYFVVKLHALPVVHVSPSCLCCTHRVRHAPTYAAACMNTYAAACMNAYAAACMNAPDSRGASLVCIDLFGLKIACMVNVHSAPQQILCGYCV